MTVLASADYRPANHPIKKPCALVVNGQNGHTAPPKTPLLHNFIHSLRELEQYKNGKLVNVDGQTLSIAAVTAAARYAAKVHLDDSPEIIRDIQKSRAVIADKISAGKSVYGVSTGFGGSADTRTGDSLALGNALLQHQNSGVLPSSTSKPLSALPLQDPLNTTSMPEAWVRGAILIRMNSLIRGHSGVRWELIEKMGELLRENITPLVPLRGSISASGDLSPLSYIAGTLIGNPSIRVFHGPPSFGAREIGPSSVVLPAHNIEPLSLQSKEHLGILNGTAFSASVSALAMHDAALMGVLAQVCTAMGTEALAGTRGSYDRFIHEVARPHSGQVEVAKSIWDLLEGSVFAETVEEEVTIEEDEGRLRQDRYPLRTAPQYIGPQIEDILHAMGSVTQELNSTTDNPLVDGTSGHIHYGGNFQAMSLTNALEKTRLGLFHLGKILFAQLTELVNPAMNRGLPPSLAATDPSLNYHCKGVDIGAAAYVSELAWLANPVGTGVQSAEMHNQAVNSLALISARATVQALDVLGMLIASYLYALCQALDLRAMQYEFDLELESIVREELSASFSPFFSPSSANGEESEIGVMHKTCMKTMRDVLDSTSTMDAEARMTKVAGACTLPLVDYLLNAGVLPAVKEVPVFRMKVASRAWAAQDACRRRFLFPPPASSPGAHAHAPAAKYLNHTRPLYLFIRTTLGIRMHGRENLSGFAEGLGQVEEFGNVGGSVGIIWEAVRDGTLGAVVGGMFGDD